MTIDINELNIGYIFKDEENPFIKIKTKAMVKKYGQFEEIKVCNVEGKWFVIDGAMMVGILKEAKFHTVNVFNFGELTRKEYLTIRLFLTARVAKLNYIGIAEAVQEICKTERDCQILASNTNINKDDIKRYKDLLTFDWQAFLREEYKPPTDLFNQE